MKGQTKWLIVFFGAFKLILHFISNTNYGLHRDEYLYFDQGQHLGWGFMEVPPFTPFIASITNILGGSIFVIRLFPALIGAITIVLATYLVKKLGGGIWATVITGFSLIFTPALLGSNSLFQPVSFNQFFWFISAFFLILAINEHKPVNWYGLGISLGLGILNKYSIAVYALAMTLAILMTI